MIIFNIPEIKKLIYYLQKLQKNYKQKQVIHWILQKPELFLN